MVQFLNYGIERKTCRQEGVYKGKIYKVQGPLVMQMGIITVYIKYTYHLLLATSNDTGKLIKKVMLRQEMELCRMWHAHTLTTTRREKRTDGEGGGTCSR